MKDSQVYVYYCKSCEEEVTSWGEKHSCPYCRSKMPVFISVDSAAYTMTRPVKKPWLKRLSLRG